MSSKLIKKLEALQELEEYRCKQEGTTTQYAAGYIHGLGEAIGIAEKHEAQQMKEPFYQLTDEQEQSLQEYKNTYLYFKSIGRKWDQDFKVDHAFAAWALEEEKLEEEK